MSKRLHSHIKHVIEYSPGVFSWDLEEVNRILFAFCDECYGDDKNSYYDDNLEIPVEAFEKMLDNLRNEEIRKKIIEEEELEEPVSATWEETTAIFQRLFEDADKSDGYVHLTWF